MSKFNKKSTKKAVEVRYDAAVEKIRSVRTTRKSIALQKDIAHTMNTIQTYGFRFFPNHYIFDDVVELEKLADRLVALES